MNAPSTKRDIAILIAAALTAILSAQPTNAQWLQWGGPNRNFTADTSQLADSWPEGGPEKLWHRPLGTGYSAITVDGNMLFTQYRQNKSSRHEFVVALDAQTGKTIWRKRNVATIAESTPDHGKEFSGPNATPLVVGDRLFTLGRNALLQCFQKADGEILWKHELLKDFGAQIETCGYSCSPLAYGDTIIVPLGRAADDKSEGKSLAAFDQATGKVVWRSQTFHLQHSSGILITFGGKDHFVLFTKEGLIGVDPANGELIWKHPLAEAETAGAFATPVWNGADTIFFSSRESGCAVRLVDRDGKTVAEPLWSNKKAPLGMATPILVGDMLVGAKRGDGRESLFAALDVNTGERLWVKRLVPSGVAIGGEKLIVLDHAGNLGLVTVTREGPIVNTHCQLTKEWSFTAPTLVGSTLYVRDEEHIMALNLGGSSNAS